MPMVQEESRTSRPVLFASREPKGPAKPSDKGSLGDQALTDAMIILVACWVALFILAWTLRKYNV